MQRLVSSLLEYSLINNRPDRHWVSLGNSLEQAKEQLQSLTEKRSVIFECTGLPTL